VSHNLDEIQRLCGRAAWLEHGTLKAAGVAADVVAAYEDRVRPNA
jgi:lipopolysaccharide transport system ATP-binding protein